MDGKMEGWRDRMGWGGVGQGAMGWDEVGWDGMRWDGVISPKSHS